jgi:hypothetical protein
MERNFSVHVLVDWKRSQVESNDALCQSIAQRKCLKRQSADWAAFSHEKRRKKLVQKSIDKRIVYQQK